MAIRIPKQINVLQKPSQKLTGTVVLRKLILFLHLFSEDIVGEFGFHALNIANSCSKQVWFLNSPTMGHAREAHHRA